MSDAIPPIDPSKARYITIRLRDYDSVPYAFTYRSKADPLNPVPIDLTNYKLEYFLKNDKVQLAKYSIDAGQLTAPFLSKTGSSHETINMEAMFLDIRNRVKPKDVVRLVEVVTDLTGKPYVHLVITIDAQQY